MRQRPIIHSRDHEHGGADPVRIVWEDVGASGGGVAALIIADEGTPLPARATLDFVGAGVTATDDAGTNKTIVTIPGGAGGGGIQYDTDNEGTWLDIGTLGHDAGGYGTLFHTNAGGKAVGINVTDPTTGFTGAQTVGLTVTADATASTDGTAIGLSTHAQGPSAIGLQVSGDGYGEQVSLGSGTGISVTVTNGTCIAVSITSGIGLQVSTPGGVALRVDADGLVHMANAPVIDL